MKTQSVSSQLLLDMLRSSKTLECPLHHDGQSVAQRLALLHGVAGQDDGGPGLPDVVDCLPDLPPGGRVDPSCWLVQQHHLGSPNQSQSHVELPLVAFKT